MISPSSANPFFASHFSELESEVPSLREGADGIIELVRAQGVSRVERLLNVPKRVRQSVHRGACCGAVSALAFVQFRSGYELCDVFVISEDVTGGALEDIGDDFSVVVEAIVNLLPLEDVINGSP